MTHFKLFFNFKNLSVLYVSGVCVYTLSREVRDVGSPGAKITGSYKSPGVYFLPAFQSICLSLGDREQSLGHMSDAKVAAK